MFLIVMYASSYSTSIMCTWLCPGIFSVYVVVTDEDGNQDWVFDEISVYADPIEESLLTVVAAEPSSGCANGEDSETEDSDAEGALLPLLPLLGFGWLRRRKKA